MDMAQVRSRKLALEDDIRARVDLFCAETGADVVNIYMERIDAVSANGKPVTVDRRIEVTATV